MTSVVEKFDEVAEFDPDPIPQGVIRSVAAGLGMISSLVVGLGDVDLEAGRGRISGTACCLWRRDGRRITIEVIDGGVIASVSNTPDPHCVRRKGGGG